MARLSDDEVRRVRHELFRQVAVEHREAVEALADECLARGETATMWRATAAAHGAVIEDALERLDRGADLGVAVQGALDDLATARGLLERLLHKVELSCYCTYSGDPDCPEHGTISGEIRAFLAGLEAR